MSSTTPPSLFFMFVFYFCISLVSFMYVKMALPAQLAITYREGGLGVQSASPAVPFLIVGKAFVLVSPSGGVCHMHLQLQWVHCPVPLYSLGIRLPDNP